MDRDAGASDQGDEARQGDSGMIGSDSEEPGPGRDTSLTEPDPATAGTEQPKGTVAMSEGDPMRTRLGGHIEGAGVTGRDVAAAEEVPATYTGEEADVAGRPEYADRAEGGDQALYQEEPQRMDRPGGGGSLFTEGEPERPDRPGPQEPGVQEGVYDQEADRSRRQRPSDGP